MQQLLSGDKQYFLASEVKGMIIPTFPELSVAQLLLKSQSDIRIVNHLPDSTEKKKPNKESPTSSLMGTTASNNDSPNANSFSSEDSLERAGAQKQKQ